MSGIRVGAVYSRNKNIIAALTNVAVFYSTALYLQVVIVRKMGLCSVRIVNVDNLSDDYILAQVFFSLFSSFSREERGL